jgi:hypothetical protein
MAVRIANEVPCRLSLYRSRRRPGESLAPQLVVWRVPCRYAGPLTHSSVAS